jgi:hypothetical protein
VNIGEFEREVNIEPIPTEAPVQEPVVEPIEMPEKVPAQ